MSVQLESSVESTPEQQTNRANERQPIDRASAINSTSRPLLRGFIVVLGLLLVISSYKAIRLGLEGWSLYQGARALEMAITQERDTLTADTLVQHTHSLTTGLNEVNHHLAYFTPLLRRLDWLPTIGPTIAAVPDLLNAGQEGMALATDGLSLLAPIMGEHLEPSSISIEQLIEAVSDSPEQMDEMAAHAESIAAILTSLETETLYPVAGEALAKVQPLLPVMAPLIRMAPLAPDLLGIEGPKHYLLLVQNNHELRATGGFLTAIGAITIADGELADLTFTDSYKVSRKGGEFPPAPVPLQRYMGIRSLLLRDANWSPDLPTTAKLIKAIYAADTGVQVDGIVTVDLRAAELLVNALAPLTIEGADEALTGETLLEQILQFWSRPLDTGDTLAKDGLGKWWHQRKDFMPKLADAALAKVESGDVDYQALAFALLTALDQRSIQIWIDDDTAAKELAQLNWDGALRPEEGGDFLALIDSNLGYNKVDYLLDRTLHYELEWNTAQEQAQVGQATVTITYEHPVSKDGYTCDITPRYGATYADSAERCTFNFVRLYVPSGSTLIRTEGIEPESQTQGRGDAETQLFGGYFVMKPGETQKVRFQYELPPDIQPETYQLVVRRQAGTKPLPLSILHDELQTNVVVTSGRFVLP